MKKYEWKRDGVRCWDEQNDNDESGKNHVLLETKIEGGNFSHAGEGSSKLKSAMKKLGIEHSLIKRSAISVYEAEMNVVIHASQGKMVSEITRKKVHTVVKDEGDGIKDIQKAMKPGFSTASEEVREMGFGAGLGFVNIKRNTDKLLIKTREGKGTRIEMTICLEKN